MQEKRASVKDIAAQLHISLSTVHKALTGKPGVSEKRREQVRRVAEELGYVVNTAAQSLARKDIKLSVIMPSKWQEYFSEMKEGMDSEFAALSEYKVVGTYLFIDESFSASEISERLTSCSPDAVLFCSSSSRLTSLVSAALEKLKLPSFRIGGGLSSPESICSITVDAALSGRLAADFFACIHRSDIRAAVFTGSMNTEVHRTKAEAFAERVSACGGKVLGVCETDDDEDTAYRLVCGLFKKHPDINCVYVSTSTSISVCRYIEENGLSGKVSVVGTDVFNELRGYIKRGVADATLYQNQHKVGRRAVRCAYDYFNMKNSYGSIPEEQIQDILISPKLLLKANIE